MTKPTIKERKELSIAGIPRKKKNTAEACAEKVQEEIQEILNQKRKLTWEEANSILIKNLRDFARLICEEMRDTAFGATRERIEKKAQEILKALE